MQPVQCKMARAALGLTIDQAASRAGISHLDVQNIDSGATADTDAETKLQGVFQLAGIEWIGEDGVRLKQPASADAAIPIEDLNSANDE